MKQISLATLLFAIVALTLYSCRKEKDTIATITVVNSLDQPVVGATVRVYCPSTTCAGNLNENMDRTEVTNQSGKITLNYTEEYELGQAGFAVLDVEVTQPGSATPDATGVIKIEEEVTNEQTIVCQTC